MMDIRLCGWLARSLGLGSLRWVLLAVLTTGTYFAAGVLAERPGLGASPLEPGAAVIPYGHPSTYDILPASDSGTYFAGGALIGSTLGGGALSSGGADYSVMSMDP